MRSYELVTVFRTKENNYTIGLEAVKKILSSAGVVVKSDEDMGDRELAYEVKKEDRGHYHFFNVDAEPNLIKELDEAMKLEKTLLKFLFVKQD